jgi:hypothetical protein
MLTQEPDMTLSEFRAWLEGYSASFTDGTPNADQWAEIQRRIQGVQVFVAPVNVPANSIPQLNLGQDVQTYFPGGYPLATSVAQQPKGA